MTIDDLIDDVLRETILMINKITVALVARYQCVHAG